MTSKDLYATLVRMSRGRRSSERKLAIFVLNETDKAAAMSLERLAEAAEVSVSSASRMIRETGCSGFSHFRQLLVESDAEEIPDRAIPAASAEAAVNSVCALVRKSVESCLAAIQPKVLEYVADILMNCREVFIIGEGTSSVTASYAFIKLFRLGIRCSYCSDAIVLKMKASLLTSGDVLVAVSSSGRTKAIIDASRIARRNGARVVAISDYRSTPLKNAADILLPTTGRQSAADPDSELPLIHGQLAIVDALSALISSRAGESGFTKSMRAVLDDKQF